MHPNRRRLAVAVAGVCRRAGRRRAASSSSPVPGTPLQDGIDAALPGDSVRVEPRARTVEAITIDKPLKLYGRTDASIDAGLRRC